MCLFVFFPPSNHCVFLFATGLGFHSGRKTAIEHSWIVATLLHQSEDPGS
jgi:hypothetical protein